MFRFIEAKSVFCGCHDVLQLLHLLESSQSLDEFAVSFRCTVPSLRSVSMTACEVCGQAPSMGAHHIRQRADVHQPVPCRFSCGALKPAGRRNHPF